MLSICSAESIHDDRSMTNTMMRRRARCHLYGHFLPFLALALTASLVSVSSKDVPASEVGPDSGSSQSVVNPDDSSVQSENQEVILPAGGAGAATKLKAEVYCDDVDLRRGIARLTWTPAASPGGEQRVDVTIYRRGLERGAFESSGPLSADKNSLVWDRVKGQAIHHWRVLTQHADGWAPSETGVFEGPPCVLDSTVPPATSK